MSVRMSWQVIRRRWMGWAIALCVTAAAQLPAQAQLQTQRRAPVGTSAGLRIQQLDIGQGDAALITTPEGRRILIDAGPDANTVADVLWDAGIDTLDLVVASHNHADHIGGMPEVFFAFVVRAYVENGVPHTTSVYRRTMTAVEQEPGLRYLEATDRTISLGSVTLRILPPPHADDSQNDNSVGVLIEYGRFRALYTGDSERPELEAWLRAGRVPRVTLVKVAHHGSRNGTTPEWVRATSPAVAVISVGADNRYHHPAPEVERQWAAGGARVYRTDRDGAVEVLVSPDGRFAIHTRTAAAAARTP